MRITFIVNPISHEIKNLHVQDLIEKHLDHDQYEYKIVYTKHAGHATLLTQDALLESSDIIAAVGGDGTVNEVGRALVNTKAALAIIPVGSGNGLARHLKIPVGFVKAVKALNHSHQIMIDTAKINDKVFLGIAGIGFDAHIAEQFALFGTRGLFSYSLVTLREFSNYSSKSYHLTIDGKQMIKKAFILSFANSSQYGNEFIIAPNASISDGFLDLSIIDEVPPFSTFKFLYQLRSGTLASSNHFETFRFKEAIIDYPYIQVHIDGEPLIFEGRIKVTSHPNSLKVLTPDHTYASVF